jgi:hypothetical protein
VSSSIRRSALQLVAAMLRPLPPPRAYGTGRESNREVQSRRPAQSLGELGLIDEYRLYIHPVVLGHGKPFFAGPRPRLRLVASDVIVEDVIRLTYVPA